MPNWPHSNRSLVSESTLRLNLAVVLALCSFLSVALGSTDGLAILVALVCLLGSGLILGWSRLLIGLAEDRWLAAGLLMLLTLLVLNYFFGWSRQSSFAATLAIALMPLGFIVARALADNRWKLFAGLAGLVVIFASISTFRLLVFQERAMWPLEDPNNYATLLYLTAIPAVHFFLMEHWSGQRWHQGWQLGFLLAFGLVATALFGTQSRTGLLILASAFVFWFVLAARGRQSMRPLLILAGLAVATYWLSRLGIPSEISGRFSAAEFSSGFGVRLALLDVALDIGSENPFLGIGLFVFPLFYRTIRDGNDPVTAGYFVHNDYVQLFAEGGIVLALLFLILAIYVWVRVLKVFFAPKQGFLLFSTGIGLALAAAFAHAIVNFVIYVAPLALLLGFLLADFFPTKSEFDGRTHKSAPLVLAGYGLTLVLALAVLAVDVATDVVLQGRLPSIVDTTKRSSEQQHEFARTVAKLAPERGVPALATAVFAERIWESGSRSVEQLPGILNLYRAAVAADPWNPNAIYMLKQFAQRRGEVVAPRLSRSETPEALLWRCLTIDPMYAPALEELAVLLGEQGRGSEFKDFLRVQLEPKLAIMHRENPRAAWLFHDVLLDDARRLNSVSRIANLEFLADVMSNEAAGPSIP